MLNGAARLKQALKRRLRRRALILIYHRVADRQNDPWRLCVTPQHLAEHLSVLRKLNCRIVHVSSLAQALQRGRLEPRSVAITFDDGYHDNLEQGRPLLERFEAPATLFASAGYIGSDEEFWWDSLQRIFLEPGPLPPTLELELEGEQLRWELGADADPAGLDSANWPEWRPLRPAPTMRHKLHDEIWSRLFRALPTERARTIGQLQQWSGTSRKARADRRPMTVGELRRMRGDGLVEIGAHGLTHTALSCLPPSDQCKELQESRHLLETMVGAQVLGCSYPQGGTSADTREQVRAAGYTHACGSAARSVRRSEPDPYDLPRISIGDWPAARFRSFIENHLAA